MSGRTQASNCLVRICLHPEHVQPARLSGWPKAIQMQGVLQACDSLGQLLVAYLSPSSFMRPSSCMTLAELADVAVIGS